MQELIQIKNNQAFANSLQIAEHFGKQHKHVIRSIEKAIIDTEARLKIGLSKYIDESGKSNKMYLLDRDSFSFIIMSFTGKSATEWKLKYIEAFNKMEAIITEKNSTDWQLTRENGKMIRRGETDAIAKFIIYAESQGSTSSKMYYSNFSKMLNKTLDIKSGNRDNLSPSMLAHVATFENQISAFIQEEMKKKKYYKDIFQEVKKKITLISTLMIFNDAKYLPSKRVA